MAIEKFNRKEQKYFIDGKTYQELLNRINDKIVPDKYFKEKICNLYFDTDNNDLIINSLKKPKYKEKVRLRSYDVKLNGSIVTNFTISNIATTVGNSSRSMGGDPRGRR